MGGGLQKLQLSFKITRTSFSSIFLKCNKLWYQFYISGVLIASVPEKVSLYFTASIIIIFFNFISKRVNDSGWWTTMHFGDCHTNTVILSWKVWIKSGQYSWDVFLNIGRFRMKTLAVLNILCKKKKKEKKSTVCMCVC